MSNKELTRTVVFGAVIIGVSLVLALGVHGYLMSQGRENNTVTVTGSTKQKVSSDLAKWTASFTSRASTAELKGAITKANDDAEKIKKFITSFGLLESGITILPLQTSPVYDSPQDGKAPEVVGYDVSREVRVESADIEKIEQLAKNSSRLVEQGIIAQYQRTEYFYTKIDQLRPALFAEATKDAQKRAEAMAGGTGSKVGSLRSARTGVIQILSPNSTDVADYGAYDLSTKEKEISATVNVSFEIK